MAGGRPSAWPGMAQAQAMERLPAGRGAMAEVECRPLTDRDAASAAQAAAAAEVVLVEELSSPEGTRALLEFMARGNHHLLPAAACALGTKVYSASVADELRPWSDEEAALAGARIASWNSLGATSLNKSSAESITCACRDPLTSDGFTVELWPREAVVLGPGTKRRTPSPEAKIPEDDEEWMDFKASCAFDSLSAHTRYALLMRYSQVPDASVRAKAGDHPDATGAVEWAAHIRRELSRAIKSIDTVAARRAREAAHRRFESLATEDTKKDTKASDREQESKDLAMKSITPRTFDLSTGKGVLAAIDAAMSNAGTTQDSVFEF